MTYMTMLFQEIQLRKNAFDANKGTSSKRICFGVRWNDSMHLFFFEWAFAGVPEQRRCAGINRGSILPLLKAHEQEQVEKLAACSNWHLKQAVFLAFRNNWADDSLI